MIFKLTLLGTNAALPVIGRAPSAQVLQVGHRLYLIDCGEGTQLRLLEEGVRHLRIRAVFISHLHGDHVFGLIGLLTSWQLTNRRDPLDLFAPPGLQPAIEAQLEASHTRLDFPVRFQVIDPAAARTVYEDSLVTVGTLPLDHRIPAAGYLFRERPRPANLRPEKLREYDIPTAQLRAIKAGAGFVLPDGRRLAHEELTLPPPPPRSFAYCSDTAYRPALAPLLRDVDLLYHEATFLEADRERAALTGHSTARQAALLAREAGVGRLVLGHFSSRYSDIGLFAEEAREVFPETIAGQDGMKIEVPFRRREI